jgi:hypothetical protein
MKGWELYSWQKDGAWQFSLLEGTNRSKPVSEIQSPKTQLDGIDALRLALESLAAEQQVIWSPPWTQDASAFPPSTVVEQVRHICEEHGLALVVAGSP